MGSVRLSPFICLFFPLLSKVGQHLVRINLSEATDMMDLLGADLPAEGGQPGQVRVEGDSRGQVWSLLLCVKSNDWRLLVWMECG